MVKRLTKQNRSARVCAVVVAACLILVLTASSSEHASATLRRAQLSSQSAIRNPHFAIIKGQFEPTWESLKKSYKVPRWFQDAKFGIFIHWGLYSIPAHKSEWYAKHMYSDPEIIKWH